MSGQATRYNSLPGVFSHGVKATGSGSGDSHGFAQKAVVCCMWSLMQARRPTFADSLPPIHLVKVCRAILASDLPSVILVDILVITGLAGNSAGVVLVSGHRTVCRRVHNHIDIVRDIVAAASSHSR